MPVFHTKTIQKILEPVAEQVSQLVILHEQAEKGAALPPLSSPIGAVKTAVTNLATVGYEQIKATKDNVLKLDTPNAIKKVEAASDLLVEASSFLSNNNQSKDGREKLITGARGILHGTSDLLLVFDEAEVRRICHVCQSIRDYLKVSEVVQIMDDLLMFVKNLTPGMASMTKLVLQRSKDLTNASHAQKLVDEVETLKVCLPNLISSIKSYVAVVNESNPSSKEAAIKNRQFYVDLLSENITKVIYLLHLVSTDKEPELEKIDISAYKDLQENISNNVKSFKEWVDNPTDEKHVDDFLSLYKIVSDAKNLGNEVGSSLGETMFKKCDAIVENAEALKKLSQNGDKNSSEVQALQKQLHTALNDLTKDVGVVVDKLDCIGQARNKIVSKTPISKEWLLDPAAKPGEGCDAIKELTSAAKFLSNELSSDHLFSTQPEEINKLSEEIDDALTKLVEYRAKDQGHLPEARELGKETAEKIVKLNNSVSRSLVKPVIHQTLESKIDDIEKWLDNPDMNDGGHGRLAGSDLISGVRKLASGLEGVEIREEMLKNASECEALSKELDELQRSGMGDSPRAYQTAAALKNKFAYLKTATKNALVKSVADEFADTSLILKEFTTAALSANSVPNREEIFDKNAAALQTHAAKLALLGQQAVATSEFGADQKLPAVKYVAQKINDLTPQVIYAGKVVLNFPENKQAQDHLKALSEDLSKGFDELTQQVDDAVELAQFVKASEHGMKDENEKCFIAMQNEEPKVALVAAGKVVRRAQRVLMAGKHEVENNEENDYVSKVSNDLNNVSNAIIPVVKATQEYAQNPSSKTAQEELKLRNDLLVEAVSQVGKVAADGNDVLENSGIVKSVEDEELPPPPCPPLPEGESAPPRPPLPEEEVDREIEEEVDEEIEEFPDDSDGDEQEIMTAARELHEETTKWKSRDNDIISAAKQVALLMAKMSRLVASEDGKKSDMIACAKEIAKVSGNVTKISMEIAEKCTDKRIRNDMKRTLDKIPTISTQLRILSTVKAASLGDKDFLSKEEEEEADQATEMLVLNAQNLMMSVKDTVRYAEAASIRIRTDTAGTVRWVRK